MSAPKRLMIQNPGVYYAFSSNTITITGIQDKNTKNSIKSNNYPKSKTLRELEKLDID